MPPLEEADCVEDAVRWPRAGADEYDRTLYGPAEPVKVRWVGSGAGRNSPQGASAAFDVDLACTTALQLGDLLLPGRYDDLPGTSEPLPDGDVYEVVRDESGTDVNGRLRRYEYKASLYGRSLGGAAPAEDE